MYCCLELGSDKSRGDIHRSLNLFTDLDLCIRYITIKYGNYPYITVIKSDSIPNKNLTIYQNENTILSVIKNCPEKEGLVNCVGNFKLEEIVQLKVSENYKFYFAILSVLN